MSNKEEAIKVLGDYLKSKGYDNGTSIECEVSYIGSEDYELIDMYFDIFSFEPGRISYNDDFTVAYIPKKSYWKIANEYIEELSSSELKKFIKHFKED